MNSAVIDRSANDVDPEMSDTPGASPHTVLLLRCAGNILRKARQYPALAALAIDAIVDCH